MSPENEAFYFVAAIVGMTVIPWCALFAWCELDSWLSARRFRSIVTKGVR